LKLAKGIEQGYKVLNNFTKLSFTKEGPFKIRRKVSSLAYELELPEWLKIHPIISIDYLQPKTLNLYKRAKPELGPIHVDSQARYIIEKICKKEIRRKDGLLHPYYLIKYMGYKHAEWQLAKLIKADVLEEVRKFEKNLRTSCRR
jgi:hypothetical protein